MPTAPMREELITQAVQAVQKHGSLKDAAKALGVPRQTLQSRLARAKNAPKPEQRIGRSLDDFRAEHDKDYIIPAKIKAALATLGASWEYEVQFAKLAGVSLADLGNYRAAFADHVVQIRRDGKRAWAGTKATAEKMREMVR